MSRPLVSPNPEAVNIGLDQATRAGPVYLSRRWRIASAHWPKPTSAERVMLQFFSGGSWITTQAWAPDGTSWKLGDAAPTT